MTVGYIREINRNYMIIDAPEEINEYECIMLEENRIDGLLRFRLRQLEEKREFCYEITSKQPISRILEKRKITGGEIRRLLTEIAALLGRIEDYLLREEALLLEPEYVYLEPDDFSVSLCMLPGHCCDFTAALSHFLKYILERTDHSDQEAVVLAYNLYQTSLKENYGMGDLMRHLSGREDFVFGGKGTAFPGKRQPVLDESRELREPPESDSKNEHIVLKNEAPDKKRESFTSEKISALNWGNGQKGKKNGWAIRTMCSSAVSACSGILFWYMTGNFFPETICTVIIVFLLSLYITGIKKRNQNTYYEEKMEKCQEPVWEIRPVTEEEFQNRISQEKNKEMDLAREEGTALLAEAGIVTVPAVLKPMESGEENIEISYVPFIIGKSRDLADWCLKKPTVSRLHVRVDRRENVYIITDLNSTNGTAVNGYLLQANETVSVKNGDIIYLADAGFTFYEGTDRFAFSDSGYSRVTKADINRQDFSENFNM